MKLEIRNWKLEIWISPEFLPSIKDQFPVDYTDKRTCLHVVVFSEGREKPSTKISIICERKSSYRKQKNNIYVFIHSHIQSFNHSRIQS